MSDFIDALNLITSAKIHELYARQDTEDPLVLRKKVRLKAPCAVRARLDSTRCWVKRAPTTPTASPEFGA